MTNANYSTINLGLPAVPDTNDPALFQELVRVYNAIKLLAQGIDTYTNDGTITTQIDDAESNGAVNFELLGIQLGKLVVELESTISAHAALAELQKKYFRYSVPKFTVAGLLTVKDSLSVKNTFSLGDPLITPPATTQVLTKASSNSPAGGVGTAAGAFVDAATRDTAIAAINANAAAITELQNVLKKFGLAS